MWLYRYRPKHKSLIILILILVTIMVVNSEANEDYYKGIRVPAEWEPQEAIWMQWPGFWEKDFEDTFAQIAHIISRHEKLHILYRSDQIYLDAQKAIMKMQGDPQNNNIRWHKLPYDNAWMRDNGPIYVLHGNELRIQNWDFNAWGGAFGSNIPFKLDDKVPIEIGKILDIPVDKIDMVHERGNLEFNGSDTVILNWSTISDPKRNLNYNKGQVERDLRKYFGVSRVIFIEGIPDGDLTKGHIDGIARFINSTTVVIIQCTDQSLCEIDGKDAKIYDSAAEIIEEAGFNVIREPIEGFVEHNNKLFDANYINWLVGNGFVIAPSFGNSEMDTKAKARIETYFPNRKVYMIEMLNSWAAGGGIHCHTNDQPAI